MHHPTWLFSALVVGTQGFRRSRCEEASSRCVTTVVVFYLEAALFAASSATEEDYHGWPTDDSTPAPRPIYDDDDGEEEYKTGFRFARCDGGSSRCILMVIYFALLAASFCLCGFCLRDVCRQYWNRRKTIPYTDEDPVPGTVGDAAPPDAVENAAAAAESA